MSAVDIKETLKCEGEESLKYSKAIIQDVIEEIMRKRE